MGSQIPAVLSVNVSVNLSPLLVARPYYARRGAIKVYNSKEEACVDAES